MYAVNGILFNHESPRRGTSFVTRKITLGVAAIYLGLESHLELGNLDCRRDWGHARDYMMGVHSMMQQPESGDYVLATGESHSVREFAQRAFRSVGIDLRWEGSGIKEVAYENHSDIVRIRVDKELHRPLDVQHLCGDGSKARKQLKWEPSVTFEVSPMSPCGVLQCRCTSAGGELTSLRRSLWSRWCMPTSSFFDITAAFTRSQQLQSRHLPEVDFD
jgi:GDPmannose 4,6-dehydratase